MWRRERAMVTASRSSKKSKSREERIAAGVRCSAGSFDQTLKAVCARRKIRSMFLAVLELRFEIVRLAFVGESELVLQIIEAIIDRGCREHQHLGSHALPHDPVHQTLIPRLAIFECVIVAKVVRLVDDDQIVVAPVDLTQPHAERFTAITKQIGVAKDVIAEAVPYSGLFFRFPLYVVQLSASFFGHRTSTVRLRSS